LREPVLREIRNGAGELTAVLTRNSYGCLVLNAARAMFVDIALPEPRASAGGWLGRLFGKPRPAPSAARVDAALAKAKAWSARQPGWGWRVYRTRAGLRLLATHALFEPHAETTQAVFAELDSDLFYRQLCGTQKCFRARLTPKPWRCGVVNPPVRWPWEDPRAEGRFKEWESRYLEHCRDYATCELVETVGSPPLHPEIEPLVNLHDDTTRAESKLPSA
jgi:hypothetical protein